MASILKRGPYLWQALVRREGHKVQVKTFETKTQAEAWAAVIESEIARGVFTHRTEVERTTLGELLTRYGQVVSPGEAVTSDRTCDDSPTAATPACESFASKPAQRRLLEL
jgi:hypothetical protein